MMKEWVKKILIIAGGAAIGFANGFFGGGGGMLCVPLLEKVMKEKSKVAHATAMLIILPISIASAITYIAESNFDLHLTLIVGIGVLVGGVVGALLLKKLNSDVIRIIFALLMIGVGIKMGFFS